MEEIQQAIETLNKIATVTLEYVDDADIFSEIEDQYDSLLATYPQLRQLAMYLTFLRATGGAHIHNQEFSLGIYGFGGYVVTSFDEGLFLDRDRYFRFGEIMYHSHSERSYALAFDLEASNDTVYCSPIESSDYTSCSLSFVHLLTDLAVGVYPCRQSEST